MNLRVAALGLLLSMATACDRPSDVLLITLDGARRDHLSAFGYPRQTSPNIDRLAEAGLAFSTIVATDCRTKPSLTSLLTSLDYRRQRLGAHAGALDSEVRTLAEVFQRNGYATAGFVATPWLAASQGYYRGFDHYDDFGDVREPMARATGDRVVAHLEGGARDGAKPLFVYVHFRQPHPPWRGDSPWLERPKAPRRPFEKGCKYIPTETELAVSSAQQRGDWIARYDGAILQADAEIGRILDALGPERRRRAIVGVTTDHGFELLDRYSATHMYNPFDEVVRTFFVLFDSRGIAAPIDPDRVQGRIFDIGPTLLARAGIEAPDGFEGVDLLRESQRLPELAYTACDGAGSVRSLDHKLVSFFLPGSIRQGRAPASGAYLYDLRADPEEDEDAKARQPEIHARFARAWEAYGHGADSAAGADAIPPSLDERHAEQLRALGYAD